MITIINQVNNNIYDMKLQLKELNTRGTVPPISYKPYSIFNMKPDSDSDSLKVYMKTHPDETGR